MKRRISKTELAFAAFVLASGVLGVGATAFAAVVVANPNGYRDNGGRSSQARADVGRLEQAVELWRSQNPDAACPTFETLKADKIIASFAKPDDPWGTPYRIECAGDAVVITSFGRDKVAGTRDDVRSPERP